ncbi:protein UPSTREAM OF FLC [Sesamum alatum]|uniref:Protein UPSTREAM OF FLC n=1 Tax=Sesamum alatum TaxID=300844 RepID=A0AAE1XT80_9LAMI|nr:protein UPSTREAM OF FLC [Sesamum alatum]
MEMEVVRERRRACRERSSPDDHDKIRGRGRGVCVQTRIMRQPTFKKVEVVYYLSRNGHLQHPHYMEVTHLAHQQLRLKDVMDRLTVLRGKGMPALYSWSCKRSYKNGYVWNDLAENDVIHPSEGAEYVLKGSELIEGCTDKLHHLQVGNAGQDSNFQPKCKSLGSNRRAEPGVMADRRYDCRGGDDDDGRNVEADEEEEEYEEKTSCTSSTTPHSRCSRGVSTDEIEEFKQQQEDARKNGPAAQFSPDTNSFSSPSTTSSSAVSDKTNNNGAIQNSGNNNNNTSKRFEDGDPVGSEPLLSRNSMLLSLIACGGSVSFRKTVPPPVVKQSLEPCVAARKSNGGGGSNLHKGVVCKAAAKVVVEEADEMMIGCMSENPRFGNLQAEEKEYFSGSIVEGVAAERSEVEPRLKRSSSHNEERSAMNVPAEAAAEEVEKEKGVKGKCIPRKKTSSKMSKK